MATKPTEQNKYVVGGVSFFLGALLMFAGVNVMPEDKLYGCDATGKAYLCDSLAKYYGLDSGKCINAKYGNKLCTSGWYVLAKGTVPKEPVIAPVTTTATKLTYICEPGKPTCN